MRIIITGTDESKMALLKVCIMGSLASGCECNHIDCNPSDPEPGTTIKGETVEIIAIKDNHALQTIFKRNRTGKTKDNPKNIIVIHDGGLGVFNIQQHMLMGKVGLVSNTRHIDTGFVADAINRPVNKFLSYRDAYINSNTIIVIDEKWTARKSDTVFTIK